MYTESTDEVTYKIGGMSYFHVDDFSLTMGQWVWQKLINLNHGLLLSLFNQGLSKLVPHFLHGKVDAFNYKVANNDNFMLGLLGEKFPLNITATKYPQFRNSDQMIELHLDGLFTDVANPGSSVSQNTEWQTREDVK